MSEQVVYRLKRRPRYVFTTRPQFWQQQTRQKPRRRKALKPSAPAPQRQYEWQPPLPI